MQRNCKQPQTYTRYLTPSDTMFPGPRSREENTEGISLAPVASMVGPRLFFFGTLGSKPGNGTSQCLMGRLGKMMRTYVQK